MVLAQAYLGLERLVGLLILAVAVAAAQFQVVLLSLVLAVEAQVWSY
jgi:hypothetical protein